MIKRHYNTGQLSPGTMPGAMPTPVMPTPVKKHEQTKSCPAWACLSGRDEHGHANDHSADMRPSAAWPWHPAPAYIFLLVMMCALIGCQSQSRYPTPPKQTAREQNDIAYELIRQGKYKQAEEPLKKALAADPMYGPAMNNLGIVYYLYAKNGERQSLYDAASWLEKAIHLLPRQPELRNNMGLLLLEAGKLADATDAFALAYEMEPTNPQFIGNLARVRDERGLHDEQTRKLLQEIIFRDTRPDWIKWAKDRLIQIPPSGEGITTIPTTRPREK